MGMITGSVQIKRVSLWFLTVGLLLAVGCMSPQKRFDRGTVAELRGDYPEAIAQYAKVLRSDPSFPMAVERLKASGDVYWKAARGQLASSERGGDAAAAADLYLEVAQVMKHFSGTPVAAPAPADFQRSVDRACRRGYEQLLNDVDGRLAAGDWQAAENQLRRAATFAGQVGEADAVKAHWGELYLAKADAALAANRASEAAQYLRQARQNVKPGSAAARRLAKLEGQLAEAKIRETVAKVEKAYSTRRYREAYAIASEAEAQLPRGDQRARQLAALRRDALAAGRREVAYAPFWLVKDSGAKIPAGWLSALNANADRNHWQQPGTPFIAPEAASRTAETMRALRYDRRNLSPEHLTILGQRLSADLVVYGEITDFSLKKGAVQEAQVAAKLRSGKPATWTKRTAKFDYVATVSIRIVDVSKARVIATLPVAATVPGQMRSGAFNGDISQLVLSAEDKRHFDKADRELEKRRVEDALLIQVNEKAAAQTRNAILKLIP